MTTRTKTARRLAPPTQEASVIRGRVLHVCRRLFNEKGCPNVTTAQIAGALGMNEGHLHYYFNTKGQIVLALFDEFEGRLAEAAARGLDEPGRPDRYADYLQNWFTVMWRYRFFYRDYQGTHRVTPSLRKRLAEIHGRGQQRIRRVLDDMVALGLMTATRDQRETLLVNAWVVFTYWIDYLAILRGTDRLTKADLEQGMRQVDSLFRPYLTKRGRSERSKAPSLASILKP